MSNHQEKASQGRVMGVDFGTRRIGIALSDPEGRIAFPKTVLEYGGRLKDAVRDVSRLARRLDVKCVVVGMPLDMRGNKGAQAEWTCAFIQGLRAELGDGIEVLEWDERLTSVQAKRAMHEAELSSRAMRGRVDKVAAALVLQGYLDFTRRTREFTEGTP